MVWRRMFVFFPSLLFAQVPICHPPGDWPASLPLFVLRELLRVWQASRPVNRNTFSVLRTTTRIGGKIIYKGAVSEGFQVPAPHGVWSRTPVNALGGLCCEHIVEKEFRKKFHSSSCPLVGPTFFLK